MREVKYDKQKDNSLWTSLIDVRFQIEVFNTTQKLFPGNLWTTIHLILIICKKTLTQFLPSVHFYTP